MDTIFALLIVAFLSHKAIGYAKLGETMTCVDEACSGKFELSSTIECFFC